MIVHTDIRYVFKYYYLQIKDQISEISKTF